MPSAILLLPLLLQHTHPTISIPLRCFRWGRSEPPALKDINITVPRGSLTAIVGPVGSGKSSLISAILGEMELDRGGSVRVCGKVAYVPQQAWMMNATVKNNILFGREHEKREYERYVRWYVEGEGQGKREKIRAKLKSSEEWDIKITKRLRHHQTNGNARPFSFSPTGFSCAFLHLCSGQFLKD